MSRKKIQMDNLDSIENTSKEQKLLEKKDIME